MEERGGRPNLNIGRHFVFGKIQTALNGKKKLACFLDLAASPQTMMGESIYLRNKKVKHLCR